MNAKTLLFTATAVTACAVMADADILERPAGIKIGQRMTLTPYVSLSCTFDSNADCNGTAKNRTYWSVNPGIGLEYKGEQWNINGNAYYNYHAYTGGERSSERSNGSYGERLGINWSNIDGAGWSLMLSESYTKTVQSDDFSNYDGQGLWRDRGQFTFSGALQRRFNEKWHAGVDASYYWLNYDNDNYSYQQLYGWDRWTAGGNFGYTASKWTDLFIAANYQGYVQDSGANTYGVTGLSSQSKGWTIHAGLGSYLTDRIQYRISGGVSRFEYGNAKSTQGFTYQGSLNWNISETLRTTLLLSSYYSPSERTYGSASRTDAVSWGIMKSLVRGKLTTSFDVSYRHYSRECTVEGAYDNDYDIVTARLAVNYSLNRLIGFFASGEYQNELNKGQSNDGAYDYERWRASLGVRFSY